MQDIVRKNADSDSPCLLLVIKLPGEGERRQYLSASHVMNKQLKKIGMMVDCPIKFTFCVARHGWASIAKSQNVLLPVISEALIQ